MDKATFQAFTLARGVEQDLQLSSLAKFSNRELLVQLLEPKIKFENYGFNKLHLDVVKLDELTEKYATQSITKKASSDHNVTPLHFACTNPNIAVLEQLLKQTSDIHVQDSMLNKPVHFAACCESPEPLKLLIEKGAGLFDVNSYRRTPLHNAAITGRVENITTILEKQRNTFKLRDRRNWTPSAFALQRGEIAPIKAFLDSGVVKVNAGQGPDRMPPLSWAAS